MPSGDGIQVDPDGLTAHAARLDRNADSLDTARQAGQHVRLSTEAYGQLCAIMPVLLDGLQRTLVDGIGTAAGSVRDTAGKLRTSAAHYRASDARAEQVLRQAGRQR
ncbi:Excreted virulence factor EspC, type VII ESX diderm [Micromonospora coriariae]|uniref:Excreted virulence factor EspC, type VII ESX diderm n=1 Tax=Micromonospora coriariae TaxID=285665 RepID=A0A1C4XEA6_9ACTN|nr:type VII secretion target [Micromonospora coriariae]SCF06883.1 Excreted virulence factor EspC, type VII ESX diderm [Micromonospora coriariae]